MKEIIFNTAEENIRYCIDFIYRVVPQDYIALTREVLNNKNLFSEIDKFNKHIRSGEILNEAEIKSMMRYVGLLKRYENVISEGEPAGYFSEAVEDFELYRYFYKEIGASLKFNPLSLSDAGRHVLEKILSFLEEYYNLISPKALYKKVEVRPDEKGLSVVNSDIQFVNKKLRIFSSHSSFNDVKELNPDELSSHNIIVYVVTIGPGIDDEVKQLMKKGEMFDAYLLNGIGAGAAEMVANDLNRYMNDENTDVKYEYKRISPGYGEWNVSDQTKIFKLLKPEKFIGVKLMDTHIMLPEKSTSGIMGLTLKED